MTVDSIARLVAANPVPETPTAESPDRLRRLIEDDARVFAPGEPSNGSSGRDRRSPMRRRILIAVPLCVAVSVVGVLRTSGSSGPGVNIAAAAYAATSPRSGIVEAVLLTRIFRGSQAGGTLRQHEWLDAKAGLRREQDSTTGPYGDTHETHVLELVSAPGRWESWSAGREANLVSRVKVPGRVRANMAFGGISLTGVEGIEIFRQLYRRGGMVLVGHERHEGRLLWKLESRLFADADGRKLDVASHTRLIVLVDPKTFLPVNERQIDVALPGHPTVVESNLLSYRRYGGGESMGSLFDLAAQHPSAQVHTSTFGTPRFVSRRHPRRTRGPS
jgi:hypothetical protein